MTDDIDANTLAETFARSVSARPDHVALIDADGEWTHQALADARDNLVQRFSDLGIKGGDTVILTSGPSFGFVTAYLACHAAGISTCVADPNSGPEQVQWIARSLKAKALVSAGLDLQILPHAQQQAPETTEAPRDWLVTSGTAGRAKLVELTRVSGLVAATNINRFVGNAPDAVEVLSLPLHHSFGIGRLRCALLAGQTVHLVRGVLPLKPYFRAIERHERVGLAMVASGVVQLLKVAEPVLAAHADRLAYLEVGSEPLALQYRERLADLLPDTTLCLHYGMTEASRSVMLNLHRDRDRLDRDGRALADYRVTVDGEPGAAGAVRVAGDHLARGYVDRAGAYYPLVAGGWLNTGDLGRFDDDGYLTILGRADGAVHVNGLLVIPEETEKALTDHPDIRAAVCFVDQTPTGMSVLTAAVEADTPQDKDAIANFLGPRLAPHQLPKAVVTVPALPRGPSGKLDRAAAAALAKGG